MSYGAEEVRHQDGIGQADHLERLWTPYRMAYIRGENRPTGEGEDTCPFCRIGASSDDATALVIHRGEVSFVVLNLYPYAPGHLMVCPRRHVADYTDLSATETAEIAAFTQRAMTVLREVSAVDGFNIGMNQGSLAGAGIAAHLHQHVVPRWLGDQNFMPIIGKTRTMPQLLHQTRDLIADAWGT